MAQLNSELILAALATIKDPATGKDLVEAGMIQGLQEKDGHVAFAIEIDPARAGQMEDVRKEAEKTVHAMDGVLTVTAVLTAEKKGEAGPPPPQAAPPAQSDHCRTPRRHRRPQPCDPRDIDIGETMDCTVHTKST